MKLRFYANCVGWPPADVHTSGGLCDMISHAQDISRKTFLKHVSRSDRQELEKTLGYAPHDETAVLTIARDFLVSYHKSKLHGQTVYYFRHSAIEFVFTPQN